MPQVNEDGTITIPVEIVKNMGARPGESIVFEEWLDPEHPSDRPLDEARTIEVSIMRRIDWDAELENRANPLRGSDVISDLLDEEPDLYTSDYIR